MKRKETKSPGQIVEENVRALKEEEEEKANPIISFRSSDELAQLIESTAFVLKMDRSEALRFLLSRACHEVLEERPKSQAPEVKVATENKTKGELLADRYMQRVLFGDWNKKKGTAHPSIWTEA
jgi:hypothetical protein